MNEHTVTIAFSVKDTIVMDSEDKRRKQAHIDGKVVHRAIITIDGVRWVLQTNVPTHDTAIPADLLEVCFEAIEDRFVKLGVAKRGKF